LYILWQVALFRIFSGVANPVLQTWLDERLFGWSSSSKRGTSAWAGSPSGETTRVGTPEHSDGEDAGDYEHVLGVLPPSGTVSPHRSRSRAGSYADLQKLRLSKPGARGAAATLLIPSTTSATSSARNTAVDSPQNSGTGTDGSAPGSPTDSIRSRHGRKSSLSDGVPVGRIAAVPRRESFDSATRELRREIDERSPQ
jgi:glycerol-3-phosphate O-acyltransferase / dihydroxyacetone phosphate acyltransferase